MTLGLLSTSKDLTCCFKTTTTHLRKIENYYQPRARLVQVGGGGDGGGTRVVRAKKG